ncbi:hypothetical protein LIER_10559 [Lithospermum erythrorhizon]|uniref:Reverse transcriptase zinc-binding domain-containing protein n=1 Tax=Lithospermum erythrorhizon TaxID=34254 RepID=A0AAV3PKZ7_LITER
MFADDTLLLGRLILRRLPFSGIGYNIKFVKRGVQVDRLCKLCNHEEEDNMHVLYHCKFTQEVSKLLKIKSVSSRLLDFRDIFEENWNRLPSMQFQQWVICLWDTWHQRNQVIREKLYRSPGEVVKFGYDYLAAQSFRCFLLYTGLFLAEFSRAELGMAIMRRDGMTHQILPPFLRSVSWLFLNRAEKQRSSRGWGRRRRRRGIDDLAAQVFPLIGVIGLGLGCTIYIGMVD